MDKWLRCALCHGAPSPGGGISSNVNTPMAGGPDSVADREYMDKVSYLLN